MKSEKSSLERKLMILNWSLQPNREGTALVANKRIRFSLSARRGHCHSYSCSGIDINRPKHAVTIHNTTKKTFIEIYKRAIIRSILSVSIISESRSGHNEFL